MLPQIVEDNAKTLSELGCPFPRPATAKEAVANGVSLLDRSLPAWREKTVRLSDAETAGTCFNMLVDLFGDFDEGMKSLSLCPGKGASFVCGFSAFGDLPFFRKEVFAAWREAKEEGTGPPPKPTLGKATQVPPADGPQAGETVPSRRPYVIAAGSVATNPPGPASATATTTLRDAFAILWLVVAVVAVNASITNGVDRPLVTACALVAFGWITGAQLRWLSTFWDHPSTLGTLPTRQNAAKPAFEKAVTGFGDPDDVDDEYDKRRAELAEHKVWLAEKTGGFTVTASQRRASDTKQPGG